MKPTIVQIIAANTRAAYEASEFTSYRSLGEKARLPGNTVRNVLQPDVRAPNARGSSSPRMDVVEKLAHAMGYEVWQLAQENFEPKDPPTRVLKRREAEFYNRIQDAYRGLDKGEFDGNSD